MAELTPRQAEILAFIRDSVREEGYPPSQRDIAQHFGFAQNAARDHLLALVRKGEIEMASSDARGIRLLKAPEAPPDGLPLLGRIAAGAPITAPDHAEHWLKIDPELFHPRADFLHRVDGDSMIDADIQPGDLVAIHQQPDASNGQIIAACLSDGASGFERITLKRYRRMGSTVTLEAANPRYAPIEIDLARAADDQDMPVFRIAGIMAGLLRSGGAR
ncbi:repressor LexA [Sinimarinibacterium sp. CAU 1509]|uniref:transcriptional repressor LexA n=1 Tax=Sinimarinibacterium sp. CAU 1509 TaxID=2562283 RepID=UPI0010ABDA7F|nr:transcriptional repressor LexA [Sinimarinibacterium sp. CAU 1509]TJY65010.1 repressor LexA [Sinimarinibacterium sp. CAU 1509]